MRARWTLLATGLAIVLVAAAGAVGPSGAGPIDYLRNNHPVPNANGVARTFSTLGDIRFSNPYFQRVGTNGRTCETCHVPEQGWTLVPAAVRELFDRTDGRAPLFRTVDGSTSPAADVATLQARRRAYALLLSRGLIRIGLPIPAGAQFDLEAIDDPYGAASAGELSLFRRPLPTTNVRFLATVMWDGRETVPGASMEDNLARQAVNATTLHAEAARRLTPAEQDGIVALLRSLVTLQTKDDEAGLLPDRGKRLSRRPFFEGINTQPFDPDVFMLFARWSRPEERPGRLALARGEALFNRREFAGGKTCSVCHNAPDAGSNSTGAFFDTGVSAARRRSSDVPLYTLRCRSSGAVIRTTDPGRALVTGRCADIGKFKVPVLRGLSTRQPYFHDGSAPTLAAVLSFYEERFAIGLTPGEREDLLAFLGAL